MAIKKRGIDDKAVEKLANELADKPYGDALNQDKEPTVRTSLSLPVSMQEALEDMALANKRAGLNLRTVSAIAREAINDYLIKHKK